MKEDELETGDKVDPAIKDIFATSHTHQVNWKQPPKYANLFRKKRKFQIQFKRL